MSSNPLTNFKIENWYHALLPIGTTLLIASLSVEMKVKGVENATVFLIALGAIFVGFGEWINHPLQTKMLPGLMFTGHPRINTWCGNLFDIAGVAFAAIGIAYQVIHLR